ncbi:hypothetical protein KFE98_05645 [bacterium SCSIO 12741]|nr:hypothetical protein KFE98_05645 [bacterium SCSIO 12741]
MKTIKKPAKSLMIAVLALGMVGGMTSCKKEGCTDSTATNYDADAKDDDGSCTYASKSYIEKLNEGSTQTLNADITANVTLPKTAYTLQGGIHVKEGATLTIPAGCTITADPNETVAYLLVERGAKIMAEGTSDAPIVFTSGKSSPERGDWGGIIICGKAPINNGSEAEAEVGGVKYGGTDASDNSGVMAYVRVEYTGNAINAEKEHNGFTFNGVGSGTTLHHLQAYMGGDDGFEWFGGTVNTEYLVSTGSKDDSFDWTFGWTGSNKYWIAEQASDAGDRGIEADNQEDNNAAAPFSNPTLENLTLIGNGRTKGSGDAIDGIKWRRGTKCTLKNALIKNFSGYAIEVEDDQTVNNVMDGSVNVTTVQIENCVEGNFKFKMSKDANGDRGPLPNGFDENVWDSQVGTASGAGTGWTDGWTKSL